MRKGLPSSDLLVGMKKMDLLDPWLVEFESGMGTLGTRSKLVWVYGADRELQRGNKACLFGWRPWRDVAESSFEVGLQV